MTTNLVFIIDNGKATGGGDYAQFKFAEHLAKRGHKIVIFAANWNKFLENYSRLPNLELRIWNELPKFMKGISRINFLWGNLYKKLVIEPYLRKNHGNIDFIIGYLRVSAIKAVELGKKYNIKTANFIFESPLWMEKQLGQRFRNEYRGKFKESWGVTRNAYLKTDVLFPISNLTKKNCAIWLGREVSEPIYPAVDSIKLDKSIKEERQIIYVGRLNEYKNVNEIIEALSKIKNAPKLKIIGSGEEEQKLRKLALNLGVDCEFLGKLNDQDKWLEIQKSMFMVFPSSFEGFGMPPAEALMCEKPCICSDIPIFREIYSNKVEYFKEHDVEDLIKKIEFFARKEAIRHKRGADGRKFILKSYTWENSAKSIEDSLKKIYDKLYSDNPK